MTSGALTDSLRETLALFEESWVPRTTREVADRLDLGRRSAYERLERLVEQGRLETKKVGANARVWWHPPSNTAAPPDVPAPARSLVDGVLDEVDVGIFVLDENFDVVWANATIERYLGLDSGRMLGRDKRSLVEEQVAPAIADADAFVQRVLATYDDNTSTEQFECRVTPDDEREERWLEHRSRPIETGAHAGGRVELYYDVTERKRAERAHHEKREEFESLVGAVDEYAIFTLDTGGHVRTWNPGAERIKGYETDEILGEHFSTFYTDEDRDAGIPERNLAAAADRGSIQDEGWRVRADGSRFYANVTLTAIRDDDGDLDGYAKVTRDMTERERAERERELLYETTRAIAEAATFDDGLATAFRTVCETTDWEYAEAWLPTGDGELRRADADHAEAGFTAFAAFSEDVTFDRGEGLPGRVWASGTYEWLADLSNATDSSGAYPRREEALVAGIQSALAVPVVADDVVAVLVFGMGEPRETDERMVETVSSVAAELGDLVARRQVEKRIERERELVQRIFDTVPVGIGVLSSSGDIVRLNDRGEELLGAADPDPGERPVYGEDGSPVPLAERPYRQVLETGEPVFDWQGRLEQPDGEHRWLSVNVTPLEEPGGDQDRVVVTGEDITQFKAQARRLERQRDDLQSELESMFERVDDAFLALDENWQFTYVNDHAAELIQRPAGELIGARAWDVVPEVAEGYLRTMTERAMETGESSEFESYVDATDSWIEVRLYPSESGLSVYFRDVTERKEREQELREYERIVEAVDDGIYTLDDAGEFRLVNDGFVSMTRYDRSELTGAHASTVFGETFDVFDAKASRRFETGETDVVEFEEEVNTGAGNTIAVENRFTRFETEDGRGRAGVIRDVTDRKRYEEQLRALYESTRELLAAETASAVDDLLVETARDVLDVPGVVVYRYDADRDSLVPCASSVEASFIREEFPAVPPDDGSITGQVFAHGDSRYYENVLESPHLQVPPDATEMRAGMFVPMGEEAILVAGSRDVDGFDESTRQLVELLATNAEAAYQRVARERTLVDQREQLAALNSLNEVVQDITGAVIEQSTREEIEEIVCERLAGTDSYRFAWIGDVDVPSQTVSLRTEAGVEGYLDGITISVDPEDARSEGPTGRALKTGEMQVSQDIRDDVRHDPWREHFEEHGVRSSAAIPVTHEGTIYGVLNVYADRPYAFEGQERAVVSQLGVIVGHAIAATERKRALLSDDVVEVEYRITNIFDALGVDADPAGRITLDEAVPVRDGEYLVFGTATPDAVETVEALTGAVPHWTDVQFRGDTDDGRFEVRLSEPPVLSAVASLGGSVERAVMEDGDYHMTIRLAPSAEVGHLNDAVQAAYPQAEMVARRQLTRPEDPSGHLFRALDESLTDRQDAALRAAYRAGFFEWPRDAPGEAVAESLDIAPATFSQHLRKAEKKVFDALLSSSARGPGTD